MDITKLHNRKRLFTDGTDTYIAMNVKDVLYYYEDQNGCEYPDDPSDWVEIESGSRLTVGLECWQDVEDTLRELGYGGADLEKVIVVERTRAAIWLSNEPNRERIGIDAPVELWACCHEGFLCSTEF